MNKPLAAKCQLLKLLEQVTGKTCTQISQDLHINYNSYSRWRSGRVEIPMFRLVQILRKYPEVVSAVRASYGTLEDLLFADYSAKRVQELCAMYKTY
jgi:hypothetical protein